MHAFILKIYFFLFSVENDGKSLNLSLLRVSDVSALTPDLKDLIGSTVNYLQKSGVVNHGRTGERAVKQSGRFVVCRSEVKHRSRSAFMFLGVFSR